MAGAQRSAPGQGAARVRGRATSGKQQQQHQHDGATRRQLHAALRRPGTQHLLLLPPHLVGSGRAVVPTATGLREPERGREGRKSGGHERHAQEAARCCRCGR